MKSLGLASVEGQILNSFIFFLTYMRHDNSWKEKKQSKVLDKNLEILLTESKKTTVNLTIWKNPLEAVGF